MVGKDHENMRWLFQHVKLKARLIGQLLIGNLFAQYFGKAAKLTFIRG